jgi:hypothetical protein
MKTLQTQFVLGLLAAAAACGQGIVDFRNDTATLSSPPDRLIRFFSSWEPNPFGTNNAPAVGTNFQVQLYYGASTAAESTLIAISAAPARLRASTTVTPGIWTAGGTRTLDRAGPGMTVMLQVRIWDIYYGATYEEAAYKGGLIGRSSVFLHTIPSAGDPPPYYAMQNFTGFSFGALDPPHVPPIIHVQPQSQTVTVGQNVTFSVYAMGAPPLCYQWFFPGNTWPGPVNESWLTLTDVQATQNGNYWVVVCNPYGLTASDVATLTVIESRLTIRQSSPNRIEVCWRTNLSAYSLESASELSSSWMRVTNQISIQGSDCVMCENALAQRYFRLRRP